jgi:hypothetical protein
MRLAFVVGLLAASVGLARADQRSLVHTYEYSTVPEGNTTFEMWNTQTRARSESGSPQLYQGVLEIEHGITEHLDIGLVTAFEQADAGAIGRPFGLAQTRLESRYRFVEKADWPIDTALYLAVGKAFADSNYVIEGRVIGGHDVDNISFTVNAIGSKAVGGDAPDEGFAIGWGAGVGAEVENVVRVGVESWGTYVDGDLFASVGPAVGVAPSSKLWAAVTFGIGLTDEPRGVTQGFLSARAIVGIEL